LECKKCGTVWTPNSARKIAISWIDISFGCVLFALAIAAFIFVHVGAFAIVAAAASFVFMHGWRELKPHIVVEGKLKVE
jgi:hypothetical protein